MSSTSTSTLINSPSPSSTASLSQDPSPRPPPANPPGNANISVRDWIYPFPVSGPLPPETPIPYSPYLPESNPMGFAYTNVFEPTVTLVLTSAGSMFVDVRVVKPLTPSDPPLPNTGGPMSRLDWAFAGHSKSQPILHPTLHSTFHTSYQPTQIHNPSSTTTLSLPSPTSPSFSTSTTTAQPPSEFKGLTHSTWLHWLDSKYPAGHPSIPSDSGDMFPMSNGRVLEYGKAYNAHLQAEQAYEEMWSDVPIRSVVTPEEKDNHTNSNRSGNDNEIGRSKGGSKYSIVLRTSTQAVPGKETVRGMVIRVGQYCQGMLKKGDEMVVERWEVLPKPLIEGREKEHVEEQARQTEGELKRNGEENSDRQEGVVEGMWTRTVRLGDMFLPCAFTFKPSVLSKDAEIEYEGFVWVVEELEEWGP